MYNRQQELYEKLLKKVNEFCLGQAAEDVIEAIDALVDTYEKQTTVYEYLLEGVRYYYEGGQFTLKSLVQNFKALEILKRNCLLSKYPDGSYELAFPNKIQPSDEDVEILKEVLK